MIRMQCPKCHKRLGIVKLDANGVVGCPWCLHKFRLVRKPPAPTEEPVEVLEDDVVELPAEEDAVEVVDDEGVEVVEEDAVEVVHEEEGIEVVEDEAVVMTEVAEEEEEPPRKKAKKPKKKR